MKERTEYVQKIVGGGYLNRLLPKVTQSCLIVFGLLCITSPVLSNADDTGSGTTDVTIQVDDSDDNIMWSAPTQIPFKATAAGTLIGPEHDAIAIRNLSAFPIRVKTMSIVAQDPFHLVDDVDKSTGDNDFQMTWNGVKAKSQVELADDGTWAMGYAGNKDGTDELPLTYSDSKIARVTADLSAAQKAATISWTVEPTVKGVKQDPKPDPNGVAFAVYSADDQSLDLYKRDRKPEVGDTFNGKTVTNIDDINETAASKSFSWKGGTTIEVVDDGIAPISTSRWFYYFPYVLNANVVKLDTSKVADMSEMFERCSRLITLDLSTWDTSNVTDMGDMFLSCEKLTTVGDLSDWDTSHVTNMYSMYYGCRSLTTVGDLSGWNVSNVTNMSGMFSGLGVATLDLLGWNVSNVTNMSDMFSGSNLTSLDLSNWDTSSVTDMGSMFSVCSNLTSLDLSNWDTSSVTDMSSMFSRDELHGYAPLTRIVGLQNWNTSNVENMEGMFNGCSHLTNLDLSDWNVSKVTRYDGFKNSAYGVIAPKWVA